MTSFGSSTSGHNGLKQDNIKLLPSTVQAASSTNPSQASSNRSREDDPLAGNGITLRTTPAATSTPSTMASLIPHPSHAEDQPLARTLLLFHTSHRFLQSGAFLGLATSILASLRSTPPVPLTRTLVLSSALRSTGAGALVGLALAVPATFGQMRGREEIEWKDRAWRLLENRGQVEVEGWSIVGMVLGAVVGARRGGAASLRRGGWVVRVVGAAAMGDLAGVGGYLGWRYGVKGGRWED